MPNAKGRARELLNRALMVGHIDDPTEVIQLFAAILKANEAANIRGGDVYAMAEALQYRTVDEVKRLSEPISDRMIHKRAQDILEHI